MLEPSDLSTETLYVGALVSVRRYRCTKRCDCRGKEEFHDAHQLVFPHHGSFVLHRAAETTEVDPNLVVFAHRDEPYYTTHPHGFGDRGSSIAIREDALLDIVRRIDPTVDDRPEYPFRRGHMMSPPAVHLTHRLLMRRLIRDDAHDPLEIEENALAVAAMAIDASFAVPSRPPRRGAEPYSGRQRDRIEAAKGVLAARLHEHLLLEDVAREVALSPFHLCRTFHNCVGMTMHRYLTRLRVRAALEVILNGTSDLADLALDVGFCSHSHFTAAFRKEFGVPPSTVRIWARTASLRELAEKLSLPFRPRESAPPETAAIPSLAPRSLLTTAVNARLKRQRAASECASLSHPSSALLSSVPDLLDGSGAIVQ